MSPIINLIVRHEKTHSSELPGNTEITSDWIVVDFSRCKSTKYFFYIFPTPGLPKVIFSVMISVQRWSCHVTARFHPCHSPNESIEYLNFQINIGFLNYGWTSPRKVVTNWLRVPHLGILCSLWRPWRRSPFRCDFTSTVCKRADLLQHICNLSN